MLLEPELVGVAQVHQFELEMRSRLRVSWLVSQAEAFAESFAMVCVESSTFSLVAGLAMLPPQSDEPLLNCEPAGVSELSGTNPIWEAIAGCALCCSG